MLGCTAWKELLLWTYGLTVVNGKISPLWKEKSWIPNWEVRTLTVRLGRDQSRALRKLPSGVDTLWGFAQGGFDVEDKCWVGGSNLLKNPSMNPSKTPLRVQQFKGFHPKIFATILPHIHGIRYYEVKIPILILRKHGCQNISFLLGDLLWFVAQSLSSLFQTKTSLKLGWGAACALPGAMICCQYWAPKWAVSLYLNRLFVVYGCFQYGKPPQIIH